MSLSERSRKYINNLGALSNIVRRIALEAGEITLHYHEEGGYGATDMGVQEKADGSLVTIADQKAEIYIAEKLYDLLPDIPVIGEEGVAAGTADITKIDEYFWLVDPLDGTQEFIKGGADFTVNIALINKQKPILGVVFAPLHEKLYAAYEGGKAIRWTPESQKDKVISVREEPSQGLTVMASKSRKHSPHIEEFLSRFKVNKIIRHGSSLKLCMIAAGKADIYPRLGPTCLWDTAAAHAIMSAAGGVITNLDGKGLTYDPKAPNFLNPYFVAAGFDWISES